MDCSIYDTILGLPLFRGLSRDDFEQIIGKVRFDFRTLQPDEPIAGEGTACNRFIFLLNGTAVSSMEAASGKIVFLEEICAPHLFEPYSLFGAHPEYCRTYRALSGCGILAIDKQYLYSELHRYNICRMNLLNMLSGRIQTMDRRLSNMHAMPLEERITDLLFRLSDIPSGRKEIRIKMNDLAGLTVATRLNVSKVLNRMESGGMIELKRGGFTVPALEKLTAQ